MRFRSAVDAWFLVLTIVLPVVLIFTLLPAFEQTSRPVVIMAIAIAAVSVALPLWLLASTRYVVEGSELRIVSGPFRWHVPLAEIREVKPSRSLLASPALSLDRLEIRFGEHDVILVSPKDRDGFLRAIGHAAQ